MKLFICALVSVIGVSKYPRDSRVGGNPDLDSRLTCWKELGFGLVSVKCENFSETTTHKRRINYKFDFIA